MSKITNYSVLMSVYHKENPLFLEQSILSIIDQSHRTNDFVIVCDGPLSEALDKVIDKYSNLYSFIKILRLPENLGLGKALQFGLYACSNQLVARMDSDDISSKDRCQTQIEYFQEHSDISVLGSFVIEFIDFNKKNSKVRFVPINHKQIVKFAKSRNPLNHPTVMFKKDSIIDAGGYLDYFSYEDYYLWVRVIQSGHKIANLPNPLVYMRTNKNFFVRRGGLKYYIKGIQFQFLLLKLRFISFPRLILNIIIRFFIQALFPNMIREKFYLFFLRRKS